jgi:bacterioferritin (cytochrome b1)
MRGILDEGGTEGGELPRVRESAAPRGSSPGTELSLAMSVDSRLVTVFSYYRSAELHGAGLLLRLIGRMPDDGAAQALLTRHVADETRHAWLWTRRIGDLGATPVRITLGYQERLALRLRPRGIAELLALSILVERRSLERYQSHAARPDVDAQTRRVLRMVTADEAWHVEWLTRKLADLPVAPEERQRLDMAVQRFRTVEKEAFDTLLGMERDAFGPGRDPTPGRG